MNEKELEILDNEFNEVYMALELDFRKGVIGNERTLEIIKADRCEIRRIWIAKNHDLSMKALIYKYYEKYDKLEAEVIETMNSVYLINVGNNKIVCTDKSLLNKCRERLKSDISFELVKLCRSEKDIEILLLETKKDEDKNNSPILQIFGEVHE